MFDRLPNFETCSETELKQYLQQLAPFLQQVLKAINSFCSTNVSDKEPSPCENCSRRKDCNKPCEALNTQLPGPYVGIGYKEKTIGISLDNFEDIMKPFQEINECEMKTKGRQDIFKVIRRTRSEEIFEEYNKCKDVFTDEQWEVVSLKYEYGFTTKNMSRMLDKAENTIRDRLRRAKKTKEQYEQKMRAEQIRILRKTQKD